MYASSAQIVDQLETKIREINHQMQEAREDVKLYELEQLEAEHAEEEGERPELKAPDLEKEKWLVCQGRGDNVPPYLRATGRVKNKNLARVKVTEFLDEYWKAKDVSESTRKDSPGEFLEKYLKGKYGTGRVAIEWTYNILYGIKTYSYDPDCETFNSILHGELPEDAYYGQKIMIDRLLQEWRKSDKQNHGGRIWGTLDRTEFTDVLKAQFPLKSDDDIKALRRAVVTDQPLPDIRYPALLEKDADGLQGKFLESLREQYINEVQQAYPKVEEAIRQATLEYNQSKISITPIAGTDIYPYLQLLKEVPIFKNCEMSDDDLGKLIDQMHIAEYHDADVIIAEGSRSTHAYVLAEGGAFATKEGLTTDLNCSYVVGDLFGELGLRQDDVRAASIIARASARGVCRCISISKDVFMHVNTSSSQNEALLLKRQMEYYKATKMAFTGGGGQSPRKKAGDSLVTSLDCIRAGLQKFDEEMPAKEIERLINVGLDSEPEPGEQHDPEEMVQLSAFMANLRTVVVKRFAKPVSLTDVEKRALFLRNVSDEEREKITACFQELDSSGDGSLDQDEVEGLLKRIYGMEPSRKQMTQLMIEMDSDGNGVIDLEEFISAMATVKEVKMAGDIFKWRQLFNHYDVDDSGELSGEELKKMTEEMWDMGSHSLELMQFMIEEADLDGDGEISWPEFCQMMQRMMDADEKRLEAKRQRTIIASQSDGSPVSKEAIEAKIGAMTWDIDLQVLNNHDALAELWRKLDENGNNRCSFGEVERGLRKCYPVLDEVISNKRNGARIIMRAFLSADRFTADGGRKPDADVNATRGLSQEELDADGVIERREFHRFISCVEFFANLWEHFVELDANRDGRLNPEEFASGFRKVRDVTSKPDIDADQQLWVTREFNTCDAVRQHPHLFPSTVCTLPLARLLAAEGCCVCRAQDGNGWVSFDEYCAWIASLHYEEPELSAEDQDFLQGGMMTM